MEGTLAMRSSRAAAKADNCLGGDTFQGGGKVGGSGDPSCPCGAPVMRRRSPGSRQHHPETRRRSQLSGREHTLPVWRRGTPGTKGRPQQGRSRCRRRSPVARHRRLQRQVEVLYVRRGDTFQGEMRRRSLPERRQRTPVGKATPSRDGVLAPAMRRRTPGM
ncbi:hypothetical protein GWK47_023731 [Chionoecetes opilio]|uniref:Uncharacterized protein n=1 Tax=Chionoecetes opilio TaxID=41210 RepID=A0A8J4XM43_CHIOP|nr:hypothetical protein GWK47_023731 [Chionoecetes opilio]